MPILALHPILGFAVASLGGSIVAQGATTHIPLAYNFNGIVHAGEAGVPDAPNGFRSIADRALDFRFGVPSDPLLSSYRIAATAFAPDIVHLGNRDTVMGGASAFDPVPDNDDIGTQPTWLANVDQSGSQTTTLAVPIPIDGPKTLGVLYQVSSGGGSFDLTLGFVSGRTSTISLSGPDWFGGVYAGTVQVDRGVAGDNLSITESRVDLSAHIGEVVAQITFHNRSNTRAGYAVLAAKLTTDPISESVQQIPLVYNFNGIVHAGESARPDDPIGFRSISDRALDFSAGVPSDRVLRKYHLVDAPGALDIVHLGNRNTVDRGNWRFDGAPDGDDVGTQPLWLANPDQTAPQTTPLAMPITLHAGSWASFLFQISNGGGAFDVIFSFRSGRSHTARLSGGDWYGGAYSGTMQVDRATPGANLSITEQRVELAAHAGEVVTAIAFANQSNFSGGYAILAANVAGCLQCAVPGFVAGLGGGNGPTLSTTATGRLGCDLDVSVAGAPALATGTLLIGVPSTPIPLSAVFPACTATLHVSASIVSVPVTMDASGGFTQVIPGSRDPALCGFVVTFQYGQIVFTAPCPITLSDGLSIGIGG